VKELEQGLFKFHVVLVVFVASCFPVDCFADQRDELTTKIIEIEHRLGGRVGVAVFDTNSGSEWLYRAEERFPLMSTFKVFACAALLSRSDLGIENLERIVPIRASAIVPWSPVTKKFIDGEGMTLEQLCEATMTMSDNTAANLVLEVIGGPKGFTGFMRLIGDQKTRLDRWEPALNEALPNDQRDTTTPLVALTSLQQIVEGDVLSPSSSDKIKNWMLNNKVSDSLFRLILSNGWRIADRSGAGGNGSRGILAVLWPPKGKPIFTTVYITGSKASMKQRDMAISEIGSVLVQVLEE